MLENLSLNMLKNQEKPYGFTNEALVRILSQTRLPDKKDQKECLRKAFEERDFIKQCFIQLNSYTLDKSPSKTCQNLKKIRSKLLKINNKIEDIQNTILDINNFLNSNKTDEEEIADFYSAYKIVISQIEEQANIANVSITLSKMAHDLAIAHGQNEKLIKSNASRNEDDSLNFILLELEQIFEKVFQRKASYNNQNASKAERDSPFIRFVSSTMEEMVSFGLEFSDKSMKKENIRQRMNRIKKNKKK